MGFRLVAGLVSMFLCSSQHSQGHGGSASPEARIQAFMYLPFSVSSTELKKPVRRLCRTFFYHNIQKVSEIPGICWES